MRFDGFPSGAPATPLPQTLLRDLTPRMTDAAELIVTLYAVDALSRQRRFPRRIALADLRECRPLIDALAGICAERGAAESFEAGLSAAIGRGTLLSAGTSEEDQWSGWVALNDADGRRAIEGLARSERTAAEAEPRRVRGREAVYSSTPEIWQSAFGTSPPPILIEELQAAEARYGLAWLRDAFAEAAANHARSWRYVQAILERWETEGRDDGDEAAGAAASGLESSRYRHLFRD